MRLTTISSLHAAVRDIRRSGAVVGLVPTMGALHDGHATLIRTAAAHSDVVITTVFVNPLQFGPTEDFTSYPRTLEADESIAVTSGSTHLFCPTVAEMYPHGSAGVLTTVSVRGLTGVLDGIARPGHFDGVATVVAKLFAMAGECRAFFGEKDYQQLAVIRRMAADLSFPVEVIGVPTVREANGLAMSSRNRYLTDEQRDGAAVIYQALLAGRSLLDGGSSPAAASEAMRSMLDGSPVVDSVDYATCVDASTLSEPTDGPVRLLIACRVGKARLIDNL